MICAMENKESKKPSKPTLATLNASVSVSIQTDREVGLKTNEVIRPKAEEGKSREFGQIVPTQTGKDFVVSPPTAFFHKTQDFDPTPLK